MKTSNIIQPLQSTHVLKHRATLNKVYSFFYFIALIPIFYYRGAYFFKNNDPNEYYYYNKIIPLLPWLVIIISELFSSFMWLLKEPIFWQPVIRTAFIERLPKDDKLAGIDVFICTADPKREPTIDVMNTVISAMSLDYPNTKLNVYLSDDCGANVTLNGVKEAWIFGTWWLPFVKRYNVKTICPKAYFEGLDEVTSQDIGFLEDRNIVKEKYEKFEHRVKNGINRSEVNADADTSPNNHSSFVQVINGTSVNNETGTINPEQTNMPFLMYIAREKNPSRPHNFKAGALNVLLRVSSTMTNSPYILVLDCDMYCNGPSSAREAMCFHLDPTLSTSLGWVQYPHKFHNISEPDIYDSQMRVAWPLLYPGMDGLHHGPVLSGTNFYIKRQALYGVQYSEDTKELKYLLGSSDEFIESLGQINKPRSTEDRDITSVSEARSLASCTYERGTKWGQTVGFLYKSVVEDVMTGLRLQSQGWRAVYMNPKRAEFLGTATTNLNDLLTQNSRWAAGLLQIGLSKYNPLLISHSKLNILQNMVSSWITLYPLDFLHLLLLAIFSPICLFYGIPLYPKVLDPLFIPFAFVFISSNAKHLLDVIYSKGTFESWMNEKRMHMAKGVTSYIFGTLECVMTQMGIREANFIPTNKASEDDKTKLYQMGKYDFRTPNIFLVPLVTFVTLNLFCFVGGVARVTIAQDLDIMFAQLFSSLYVLVMSFPVIDGMIWRKDSGRIPVMTSMMSTLLSIVLLALGYFIL